MFPSEDSSEPPALAGAARASAVTDDGLATLSDTQLQAVLATVVRAFAARVERRGPMRAFARDAATATDVAVTATAMLEAVEIGVFELSMWQSAKGNHTS